jgi:cell division transport system permease protein
MWKHVRRSPYQALTAILAVFLTFLVSGIFFLASIASTLVLSYFESKPQITAFFTDDVTASDIETLTQALENSGKISSVKYVSKEEALVIYREQNKDDPLLLEMVTADILPASLEVSATEPKFLSELVAIVNEAVNIEEVVYQKDVVDALLAWTNAIRGIGAIFAGLLTVDAVLIIMTVINMKIAFRKDEVEILKLVGATRGYISMPFILEGAFYGMLGASLAWVTISSLLLWFRPFLISFLSIVPIIASTLANPVLPAFYVPVLAFLGLMLAVGFILGSVGSYVALSRYLKF